MPLVDRDARGARGDLRAAIAEIDRTRPRSRRRGSSASRRLTVPRRCDRWCTRPRSASSTATPIRWASSTTRTTCASSRRARNEFIRAKGLRYRDFEAQHGLLLPVAEAQVGYRRRALRRPAHRRDRARRGAARVGPVRLPDPAGGRRLSRPATPFTPAWICDGNVAAHARAHARPPLGGRGRSRRPGEGAAREDRSTAWQPSRVRLSIDVPVERFFDLVVDYARYPEFVPGIKACRVKAAGGRGQGRSSTSSTWASRRIQLRAAPRGGAPAAGRAGRSSPATLMKVSNGSWELRPTGGRTRAPLHGRHPDREAAARAPGDRRPGRDELTRVQLPRTLEAFKRRAEAERNGSACVRWRALAWRARHARNARRPAVVAPRASSSGRARP